LVNDERIKKKWSKPHVLPLIEFALNDRRHTESPHSAFELKFGSEDARYFKLPETLEPATVSNAWLRELNENLKIIREKTKVFQEELIAERTRANAAVENQNMYQPGDFVLYDTQTDAHRMRREKLANRYTGPYEVIKQYKDEVEVRHLCMGFVVRLLVERVKLFNGTRDEAYRLSLEDADQFVIDRILAWKGEPSVRTSMEFLVKFADGEEIWKPWDQDLSDSLPFAEYCRQNTELMELLYDVKTWRQVRKALNSAQITLVHPGDVCYINIRYFGSYHYDNVIDLPDKYLVSYMVRCEYLQWTGKSQKFIDALIVPFKIKMKFSNLFVVMYGTRRDLEEGMVEITPLLLFQHPNILEFIPDKKLRQRVHNELQNTFTRRGERREGSVAGCTGSPPGHPCVKGETYTYPKINLLYLGTGPWRRGEYLPQLSL